MVKHRYGRANPTLREDDTGWRRNLDTLRHAELSHLSSLVRAPQRPGKGCGYARYVPRKIVLYSEYCFFIRLGVVGTRCTARAACFVQVSCPLS